MTRNSSLRRGNTPFDAYSIFAFSAPMRLKIFAHPHVNTYFTKCILEKVPRHNLWRNRLLGVWYSEISTQFAPLRSNSVQSPPKQTFLSSFDTQQQSVIEKIFDCN